MNILLLCLSPSLGGLELYAFRSATGLSEKHNVNVIAREKLLDHFRNHSQLEVHEEKRLSMHFPLLAAFRLAKYIDKQDIDIIHVHWVKDLPLAVLSKLLSHSKPAIAYTRQMQITRKKTDPYHRFIYRHVNLILAITEQLTTACKQMIDVSASGAIRTLYHGVTSPEHFLNTNERHSLRDKIGLSDNDFIVGLFGRLEESKGQGLLIKAIAIAKQKGINIRALVVGHEMKPGYIHQLNQLASGLDVDGHIVFHGFVNKPQELMQICDCVVLATAEETFGLVLPEAMRAGIAVIGSNRGGVTEIIDHESTGLLFESLDAQSLSEQIMRLHNDEEFRKTLAKNGQHKADTVFNDKTHLAKLELLLEQAIS